ARVAAATACSEARVSVVTARPIPLPPQALLRSGFVQPDSLAARCWAPVLAGADVVAVTTAGTVAVATSAEPGGVCHRLPTGAALAYLPPLLAWLCNPGAYQGLPFGNGPLLLVLCAGWRCCLGVHHLLVSLLAELGGLRCALLCATNSCPDAALLAG
ncbi:unnamed protein product, partial [Lampetra planeri]